MKPPYVKLSVWLPYGVKLIPCRDGYDAVHPTGWCWTMWPDNVDEALTWFSRSSILPGLEKPYSIMPNFALTRRHKVG